MDTRMCNVQITSPVVILYNACAITMPFCLLERVPLQQLACSQFSHLVFKILQKWRKKFGKLGKTENHTSCFILLDDRLCPEYGKHVEECIP